MVYLTLCIFLLGGKATDSHSLPSQRMTCWPVCTKCVRPAHFNPPTWYAPPVLSWAWPSGVACLPQFFSWYLTPKEGFILHLHICFSCIFVLRRFLNWVCSWYFWKVDTIVQVRTSSTACAPQALLFFSVWKACVAFRPWAAVSLLHHPLSSNGLASSIQCLYILILF